jgi:hypothetical protein
MPKRNFDPHRQLEVVAKREFESLSAAKRFAAKFSPSTHVRQIGKLGSRWYKVLILKSEKQNPAPRRIRKKSTTIRNAKAVTVKQNSDGTVSIRVVRNAPKRKRK